VVRTSIASCDEMPQSRCCLNTYPREQSSNLPQKGAVEGGAIPGFDLTFSAPKSASLPGRSAAHQSAPRSRRPNAAVDAALAYMQEVACWTRRGAGGRELTRRLGVRWREVANGIAEIEGFDPDHLRAFSTRRQQILEAAGEGASARARQIATLATREAKDTDLTTESLRDPVAREGGPPRLGPRGNPRRDGPPNIPRSPSAIH
jgi:hypothetical protein